MSGNTNTYVVNVQLLNPPIVASKVRFVPHSPHSRTVCMRVEAFGCLYNVENKGNIIGKAKPFSYRYFLNTNYHSTIYLFTILKFLAFCYSTSSFIY